MKIATLIFISAILFFTYPVMAQNNDSENKPIEIDYLSNPLPDSIPQIFAPGIISTGMHEHSPADFTPDGKEVYFTVSLRGLKIMLFCRREQDKWGKPQTVPFSGMYRDEYQFFSPTGDTIFFLSRRPLEIGQEPLDYFVQWFAVRTGNTWNTPQIWKEWHPDLWASEMLPDKSVIGWFKPGLGDSLGGNIVIQRFIDGNYIQPESISENINTDRALEYCPTLSPDGKTIVFSAMGRPEGDGLYISYLQGNGEWSIAKPLHESINKTGSERFPRFSPDGKFLFFNRADFQLELSSNTPVPYDSVLSKYYLDPLNGNGDIYWVRTQFLKTME